MIDLTIRRDMWLRGIPDASRLLRSDDGKMCCLGFLAMELGAMESEIRDKLSPRDAPGCTWPKGMLELALIDADRASLDDTEITLCLMRINDDKNISDSWREETITKLMEEVGVRCTFVD